MADRILILERVPGDLRLWRYGLADTAGRLPVNAYVLDSDPAVSGPPHDLHAASLWTTAILLVRRAGSRDRVVYDLNPPPITDAPEPPPRGPDRRCERSTGGTSKGRGETLSERAKRAREGRPQAAA